MKNKCLIVVSRYKEDVSWLRAYPNKSFIFNKGPDDLKGYDSAQVENIGANQYDICRYIYDNYDNLPDTMAFVQGNPYDHCNKEKFDVIIKNNWFSGLESYEHLKEDKSHKKCNYIDWGYMEINNSWYIAAHNRHLAGKGLKGTCRYNNFDDFMNSFFCDYKHVEWLRFSPGAQYLVEKERCLRYPRSFWGEIMGVFPQDTNVNGGTEAHIVERALWLIFNGFFRAREKALHISTPPPPRLREKFLPKWVAGRLRNKAV